MSTKQNILFWVFAVLAFTVGFSIMPGLNILVWHLLNPHTFFEKFVLLGLYAVVFVPECVVAFIVWALLAKLACVISD